MKIIKLLSLVVFMGLPLCLNANDDISCLSISSNLAQIAFDECESRADNLQQINSCKKGVQDFVNSRIYSANKMNELAEKLEDPNVAPYYYKMGLEIFDAIRSTSSF